jgi:acetoin utilization protein AcuB
MRTIADYMTKQPWSVQIDDSITVALRMLAEREIHHLPVLDGGRLVGMVEDRGTLAKTPDRDGTVERVMTVATEVDADTPFSEALGVMSERERDALVVTRDGTIVGIFTAMDAVRVLRERTRARPRTA